MDTYLMNERPSYTAYRERFLAAVQRHQGRVSHYEHPLKGRDGETLYTDVAEIGNPDATKWLIIISGTHGVEGYYGSMCQTLYLQGLDLHSLDADTGLLFIHLINPWGTSWLRRVNEDNVDLNRNFIDFTRPLQHNDEYDNIASVFNREAIEPEQRRINEQLWHDRAAEIGETSLRSQITAGQHQDPEGIFYAGQFATWSNQTLRAIFANLPKSCKQAICMDLHTGAGDFGHPMLMAITDHDYPGLEAAKKLFGPWLYTVHTAMGNTSDTGVSASVDGYTSQMLINAMQDKDFMQLVIECGTYSPGMLEHSLRFEHLHYLDGKDPGGHQEPGHSLKTALLEHFFPHDQQWREIAWVRTRQIFDQALVYLRDGQTHY